MMRKVLLPAICLLLFYGFWVSPDFKEISAGVAIFLFGMLFLEEGFRAFTGGLLEKILFKTTNKLWKSIGFGVVATTIMQSSSLVSVITISFLSAELITLASGIGIIFGANIGTTTGAWLIAGFGLKVKISAYAMPMLVIGIIMVFQKSSALKGIGYVLAGLGFLFLGIHHMKEGFEAFRSTIDLTEFAVSGYAGLFIFAGLGVFATVVMQSSHATLVLIITALAANQITYENALALAIGANIGTTITAILGSLSSNYMGKRLAAAHLIFNVITGIIAIAFIYQIMAAVESTAAFLGIANDDWSLKLAVFHTIFNVIGVSVMVPFVGKLVVFLEKVMPAPKVDLVAPKYLNESVMGFPETLLEAVRNETLHLYDNAFEIMSHGINLHRSQILSDAELEEMINNDLEVLDIDLDDIYERKVKSLYAEILSFISEAQTSIPSSFSNQLFDLRQANRQIVLCVKSIKHMRKNLTSYMVSDNVYIRNEYNALRIQISAVMREMHALRQQNHEDRNVLDLDGYKVEIERNSSAVDGSLDALIREGKVTAIMGTSLMNDHGYTRNLIWNLTDVGKVLYGTHDSIEKEIEDLIGLDEDDVENILDAELLEPEGMMKE